MREEGVVARPLPAQIGEARRVNSQQHQAGLAREVFARGANDLLDVREVDEPVPPVIGRPLEAPGPLGRLPVRRGQDLVDQVGPFGHGAHSLISCRESSVAARRGNRLHGRGFIGRA